ncbi:MAG: flavin reductase family protein [Oscillospiraceae bacterium]|nr:flavin reductase family protein [Oscillospiraceae bacterium]
MRKNLGVQPALFPMPVVIVAAYGADGNICALNAAWAQICDMDKIALFIDADHKTTKNIMETKAFTVSIADVPNIEVADFLGIATGNKMSDKFERTGYHAVKSEFVNAPIITEFPVTLECEFAEEINTDNMHAIVGKIVNVSAEESVVGDKDKILPEKVNALVFDQYRSGYFAIGEKVGQAWNAGKELMNK